MIIFITGFPGVGKTTTGRALATTFNARFTDLDEEIIQSSGLSIADFFNQYGETAFRNLESEILNKLISVTNGLHIIALGGGSMCTDENCKLILQSGVAVYLAETATDLLARSGTIATGRPLFSSIKPSDLRSVLLDLYNKRAAYYAKSQVQTLANREFSTKKLAKMLKLLTNRSQSL